MHWWFRTRNNDTMFTFKCLVVMLCLLDTLYSCMLIKPYRFHAILLDSHTSKGPISQSHQSTLIQHLTAQASTAHLPNNAPPHTPAPSSSPASPQSPSSTPPPYTPSPSPRPQPPRPSQPPSPPTHSAPGLPHPAPSPAAGPQATSSPAP